MTFSPTPPAPNTTIDAPASTLAVLITAPTPVITPHPTRHAASSGAASRIGTAPCSATTVYSLNDDTPPRWCTAVPFCEKRVVPSRIAPATAPIAATSQRWKSPRPQKKQVPHYGTHERTTWSPFFSVVTPAPTSSTTPAPSCPSTIGNGVGMSPFTTWRSL